MAMIYTLVSSAKDWLSERFAQDADDDDNEDDVAEKDEVWVLFSLVSISLSTVTSDFGLQLDLQISPWTFKY